MKRASNPKTLIQVISCLLFALAIASDVFSQKGSTGADLKEPKNLSPKEIAQSSMPSVVVVISKDASNRVSQGTGFFVAKDIVVTNFHVVKNKSEISVKFINTDKTYEVLGALGVDKQNDLALLKIATTDAKPLRLESKTKREIGEVVYVVGNPEGLEGTFSQGIISSLRGNRYVQITAPISKGSSGSPVMNEKGFVIGVAVGAKADGQNLNFAIPVSYLKDLMRNVTKVMPLENAFLDNSIGKDEDLIQTLRWLKETFESFALPFEHKKTMSINGCIVSFRHDWFDETARMSVSKVMLGDLDPTRVLIQPALLDKNKWALEIKTFKRRNVIQVERYDPNDPFASTRARAHERYVITFNEKDLALRFSTALQKVISSCGGQSEP